MKQTRVQGPDGGFITVEHPDGASEEDIIAYAQKNYRPTPIQIGAGGLPQALRQTGEEQGIGGRFATGIANAATRLPSALLSLPTVFGGPDLRPDVLKNVREPLTEATKGAGGVGLAGDLATSVATTIPLLPARIGAMATAPGGGVAPGTAARFFGSRLGTIGDVAGSAGLTTFLSTEGGAGERGKQAGLSMVLASALPIATGVSQAVRRGTTQSGRELAKAELIRSQLGKQNTTALQNALRQPYDVPVQGVRPTAAMLTQNPVLQNLELGSRVKTPQSFAARDAANAAARWGSLQNAAGSADDLAQFEAVRNTLTKTLRESALKQANKVPAFDAGVERAAQDMMSGPTGANPAVRNMAKYVLGELDQGPSAERLYEVRKVLTDAIPRGTELGASISGARRERVLLVKAIDEALDNASGGTWAAYRRIYQGLSESVTSTKALQAIEQRFNPAGLPGVPPAFGANPAPQYLGREIAKQGTKQFGSKTFDRLSPTDRQMLNALVEDLRRQQSVMKAGGIVGSDTAAKIAAGERADDLAIGLFGKGIDTVSPIPGIGTAMSTVAKRASATRRERALAEILQDPEKLADLLAKAQIADTLLKGSAEIGGRSARGVLSQ